MKTGVLKTALSVICLAGILALPRDRKSTRLNSSHLVISYAVFCLKKKKTKRAESVNKFGQIDSEHQYQFFFASAVIPLLCETVCWCVKRVDLYIRFG